MAIVVVVAVADGVDSCCERCRRGGVSSSHEATFIGHSAAGAAAVDGLPDRETTAASGAARRGSCVGRARVISALAEDRGR